MGATLANFWLNEGGQDMVEYSLLLAFVALAAVGLLSGIRISVLGMYSSVNGAFSAASTGAGS
jgi:Flp pilus assembly pilin Flp